MLRKTTLALTAAISLGAATALIPTAASATYYGHRGGHYGHGYYGHGYYGHGYGYGQYGYGGNCYRYPWRCGHGYGW